MTNMELAVIYVDTANVIGYFHAECILMEFLPKNKPDGKCSDVPMKNREALAKKLREAKAEHSPNSAAF